MCVRMRVCVCCVCVHVCVCCVFVNLYVYVCECLRERTQNFALIVFHLFNRTRKLRPPPPHLRIMIKFLFRTVNYFSLLPTNSFLTRCKSGKVLGSLELLCKRQISVYFLLLFSPVFLKSGTLFLLHFLERKIFRELCVVEHLRMKKGCKL